VRALSSPLRKQLETSVLAARRAAEAAARAAVEGLGVFADRRPEHLDDGQAALRNGLRAKWRQLRGDRELLIAECAYEQWHRLLFARFLAENDLLLHPEYRAAVTLADCEELAAELGEPDAWSVAARFAAEILPGIFRLDDPCVRLRLAPEGRHELERILGTVPAEAFAADDALGWVYQFWQKDKKDEINDAERKVGGADLGPLTQLFTENYMVRFLLENSLGAWWAARRPESPLVAGFDYLRLDGEGNPVAGGFEDWPESVAALTVIDPCCGSGHFLVEAFSLLWRMRAEEEGLDPVAAQDAVLRDNLFGLELDPRCVQIAMFGLALQAWKAGGAWRQLPVPNVACSGVPVRASAEEWKALAKGDQKLEGALGRLHTLFREADALGSLIDPRRIAGGGDRERRQGSLEDVEWPEVAALLGRLSRREGADPAAEVLGGDAAGMALAATLLSRRYTLVATNVPFLQRSRQIESMRHFAERYHAAAREDLATTFVHRCLALLEPSGAGALVTPRNWFQLGRYRAFREALLEGELLAGCTQLGSRAFDGVDGEVVNVGLVSVRGSAPAAERPIWGCDVSGVRSPAGKAAELRSAPLLSRSTAELAANPDARLVLDFTAGTSLLSEYAEALGGITTGDSPRYRMYFWEVDHSDPQWSLQQGPTDRTAPYRGRERVLRWEGGRGELVEAAAEGATIAGRGAWGRKGVAVRYTGDLPITLYTGELFENVIAVLVPRSPDLLGAIWAFCSSPQYARSVRAIDHKIGVTANTLAKVPFDVEHWRRVATEAGPLPPPHSDDPTQWLFEGRPERSVAPLQVAVGRLLGYRWPAQAEGDDLASLADRDGIVCLPSVAGEPPAAERLQRLLAAAFGETWSPGKGEQLLRQAGSSKKNLGDWLRDEFFKQHCALFGNRPFAWHVWDGQRDGFAALVNFHRLDRKALEKLTYTYLGQDWVERQRAEARDEVAGAEARLAAALDLQRRLELILDGEDPYDIHVRWKREHEQPLGWDPDVNDGVRLNVRPFVEAEVLRTRFNVGWAKDRGREPDGSERRNDRHLTLAAKRAAREQEALL
jgi:hypothetical protein